MKKISVKKKICHRDRPFLVPRTLAVWIYKKIPQILRTPWKDNEYFSYPLNFTCHYVNHRHPMSSSCYFALDWFDVEILFPSSRSNPPKRGKDLVFVWGASLITKPYLVQNGSRYRIVSARASSWIQGVIIYSVRQWRHSVSKLR